MTNNAKLHRKDKTRKAAMKAYVDKREHAKQPNIKEGDCVLIRRDGMITKGQTPYHMKPYTVIKTKGSMITAQRKQHRITRTVSRFKRINKQPRIESHESDE